ncbi:hypothetical protein G0Q06_03230 [Puniceicoccales bacterium CK1056]|uniref:Uncharacterized protein n=1 Tax=Oceanipulchritudo coccoides TaxID=2706888 RepID=A0A6B2LZG4_9BACT|nr:hypothetical protein [Oceanipulchritudo coccoides]NDV61456.1 hypothetical protein [Oceanipulchritudo coccoides]
MKSSASFRSAAPVRKKLPDGTTITLKRGFVSSLDGKQTISLKEFDRLFDEGSDEIDAFIDWSNTKVGHGGRRPGAGRKPTGRRQYTIRLKPEAHARLKSKAKARHQTLAELIESMAEN